MKLIYFLLISFLFACKNGENSDANNSVLSTTKDTLVFLKNQQDDEIIKRQLVFNRSIDSVFLTNDLVDLQKINSSIKIDVKYASSNNFMGIQLYDTISKIYLNIEVAIRLSNCQNYLDSICPGFSLLVYDGVRPLLVQKEMWNALDSIPVSRRGRFVSNPIRGSVHNYGAAVDLTIVDSSGNILDMGAGYDDFREIAFPSLESRFLKTGELSDKQWKNRKLLRRVMKKGGFHNIPSEWWHFNAYSRVISSRKYKRILDESGGADWYKLEYPKKDSTLNEPT